MKKCLIPALIFTFFLGCSQAGSDDDPIDNPEIPTTYGEITLYNSTYNRLAYRVDNSNDIGTFSVSPSTGIEGFLDWHKSINITEETGSIVVQWAITDPIVSVQSNKTFTLTESGYTVTF